MTRDRSPLAQAGALLALAALLGTFAQVALPTRIPWREDWSHFVQAKALRVGLPLADVAATARIVAERSHLLLDARPLKDYDAGRIPGALSLPQADLDRAFPQVAPLLSPGQAILVYCSGHACDESFELAEFLRGQGFTNVVLFAGGMADWTAAGQAVER